MAEDDTLLETVGRRRITVRWRRRADTLAAGWGERVTRQVRSRPLRHGLWIVAWAVLTLFALVAYAAPLWQNALADTPLAYLIWIPLLAVGWGAYNLATVREPYPDDRELNLLVGGALLLMTGFVAAVGPDKWPVSFVYYHAGLLVWPLWALGLAWLLFGLGVTPRLIGPLVYLWLVWPPIFTPLVNATQSVLTGWSIRVLDVAAHATPWVKPSAPLGNFLVQHGSSFVGVVVAQVCSGADSLLGAAILLPLFLTFYRGPWLRRLCVVAVALVGALAANWLRLFMLVAALHWLGAPFTFGILHPVLGVLLFMLLAVGLMGVSSALGLLPTGLPASPGLQLGGRVQLGAAVLLGAGLFAALLPVFSLPLGNLANPVPIRTAKVEAMLPAIDGFASRVVYRFNEGSVLGRGAYTVARVYENNHGAAAIVEVWSTPDQGLLLSYGFDNCLIYHGNQVVARYSFAMKNGLPATIYAVKLPSATVNGPKAFYLDIEWQMAVHTPHGVRYVRWSIATLPFSSSGWPQVAGAVHPLRGLQVLAVPPTEGSWPHRLIGPQGQLERFAVAMMMRFRHDLRLPG